MSAFFISPPPASPSLPPSSASPLIDCVALSRFRDRAVQRFSAHDFVYREANARLLDRLADVRRRFPLALNLGARNGALSHSACMAGRFGIDRMINVEASVGFCAAGRAGGLPSVCARAEELPFRDGCFDLVLSSLELQWVNHLPLALRTVQRLLKPDGLFLACFAGGETLQELRYCLREAEVAITGGLSPRVLPMIGLEDASRLVQHAGFALPVADREIIPFDYDSPRDVLRDLQGMGASNALMARHRAPLRRDVLARALSLYAEMFGGETAGSVRVTVELIFLIGWAPHPEQPLPLPRGSGKMHLSKALGRE